MYTYFSENSSESAFVINFCFSSKQPVINSLQTKGCQIMQKNIFEESLCMSSLQESFGLRDSVFIKILCIFFVTSLEKLHSRIGFSDHFRTLCFCSQY